MGVSSFPFLFSWSTGADHLRPKILETLINDTPPQALFIKLHSCSVLLVVLFTNIHSPVFTLFYLSPLLFISPKLINYLRVGGEEGGGSNPKETPKNVPNIVFFPTIPPFSPLFLYIYYRIGKSIISSI